MSVLGNSSVSVNISGNAAEEETTPCCSCDREKVKMAGKCGRCGAQACNACLGKYQGANYSGQMLCKKCRENTDHETAYW